MRVLVLDDTPMQLRLIRTQVEGSGHEADPVTTIAAARAALAARAYDALLTDILLDDGNGADLCRELRADDRWSSLVILLLSARDEQELQRVCSDCGADGYLAKPFVRSQLQEKLASCLAARAER